MAERVTSVFGGHTLCSSNIEMTPLCKVDVTLAGVRGASVAPGAVVENKRLGAALAFARELQTSDSPNRRRGDPRRQRPPNNLEAPGMPTKGRPSRKVLAATAAE